STAKRVRRHGVDPNRSFNEEITIKTSRRAKSFLTLTLSLLATVLSLSLSLSLATPPSPLFQSFPSPPQGGSIFGKGTITSASVSPIFPDQSPAVARLETVGICRIPTELARTSLLSISSVSPPFLSSEAPGVRLTSRRDPREVQLARTSSLRRTKETTRAISLASAPPPKYFGYGQITGETLPNFRQKSEED
ncbi:hypothetical protein Prudu_017074, partial [Prunus dulcis]